MTHSIPLASSSKNGGQKSMLSLLFTLLLTAVLTVLLSACGFHLRGASSFPFKTIFVAGPDSTPLGLVLRRNLTSQSNIQLTTEANDADVVLDILSERPEKVILSLTVQGFVREYTLNSYLTFQVRDKSGQVVLPPTTIMASRVISYNENVVLSKAVEEAAFFKEMQGDLAQQIVRRLSAMKMDS